MGVQDRAAAPRGRDLPAIAAELASLRRSLAAGTPPEPSRLSAARMDLEHALASRPPDGPPADAPMLACLLDELEQLCNGLAMQRDQLGGEIRATVRHRRARSAYRGSAPERAVRP